MKKLLILSLVFACGVIYAGAILINFQATSRNGNVVITWQASSEVNLKHYVIERNTVKGSFVEIATVNPKADHNYEYIDQSAYKTSDVFYIYRLKIVDNDGSVSYSGEFRVLHDQTTGVKRTWGSIKALFR